MKKLKILLLLLMFNCSRYTLKSDWGYQKKPFKDHGHGNYAGKWRRSNNPKQDIKHNVTTPRFIGVVIN